MTFVARRFASRTSDTWPSWRAPMVGTSAVVAFFALMLSRARRNAGTVRTIMGLRDLWARSIGSRRLTGSGRTAGMPTLSRPRLSRQAAGQLTFANSDRDAANPDGHPVERASNREAPPRPMHAIHD